MSKSIVPLHKEKHKNIKIKSNQFQVFKNTHIIPVVIAETTKLSSEMPLVFIKDPETGQFRIVALTGVKSGENLFFNGDEWDCYYLPAVFRAEPFSVARVSDDNSVICINEESELVNEDEGEPLFTEAGELTEFTKYASSLVTDLVHQSALTAEFCQWLAQKQLLESAVININTSEGSRELNGLYRVDERKLIDMSDADFLDMRKKGFLPAVYSHLSSQAALANITKRVA